MSTLLFSKNSVLRASLEPPRWRYRLTGGCILQAAIAEFIQRHH